MKFTILTLFPDMVQPFLTQSVIGRAVEDGKIAIEIRNLRDWATDKHHTVDDTPYGGGAGMVLKVDVVDRALAELKTPNTTTILLTPQGKRFTQEIAETLAKTDRNILLIAGHYEGFDERIRLLVDEQLSIGDFVLTGGELPAAIIVDAVARLLPGVLGDDTSSHDETFSLKDDAGNRLIEYPNYTRPDSYTPASKDLGEQSVPEVLKSGNHAAIEHWRLEQAKERTERSKSD